MCATGDLTIPCLLRADPPHCPSDDPPILCVRNPHPPFRSPILWLRLKVICSGIPALSLGLSCDDRMEITAINSCKFSFPGRLVGTYSIQYGYSTLTTFEHAYSLPLLTFYTILLNPCQCQCQCYSNSQDSYPLLTSPLQYFQEHLSSPNSSCDPKTPRQ
jgi:hypothetical protein